MDCVIQSFTCVNPFAKMVRCLDGFGEIILSFGTLVSADLFHTKFVVFLVGLCDQLLATILQLSICVQTDRQGKKGREKAKTEEKVGSEEHWLKMSKKYKIESNFVSISLRYPIWNSEN